MILTPPLIACPGPWDVTCTTKITKSSAPKRTVALERASEVRVFALTCFAITEIVERLLTAKNLSVALTVMFRSQVPIATKLTVGPLTVQTEFVEEVRVKTAPFTEVLKLGVK